MMKLRLSTYNMYTKLSPDSDELAIINGMTGDVFTSGNSRLQTLRRSKSDIDYDEILRGIPGETVASLMRMGMLTDMSEDDEIACFKGIVDNMHEHRQGAAPGYTFLMSYECNFRCNYCYQSKLNARIRKQTMSKETADKIFAQIPRLEKNTHRKPNQTREFSFIGGEALVKENVDIISYIIDRAKSLGPAAFGAVSNCYELEHFKHLLGPDGIRSIQVTFDGPPDRHDQVRKLKGGAGTFDKIANNIDMALQKHVIISARINVTLNNLDDLPELVDIFADRGWAEYRSFSAYLGQIHGDNIPELPRGEQVDSNIANHYIESNLKKHPNLSMIKQPELGLRENILQHIQQKKNIAHLFKSGYCGAHFGSKVFDAYGKLHTCIETDTKEGFSIGQLDENGVLQYNETAKNKWRSRSVSEVDECSRCAYALLCGGGCAVQAEQTKGEFFSSYCNGFQDSLFPPE